MTANMNQQLSELLAETIVKFCRKHNYFDTELKVQGTVCIMSDASSFLVTQISDKFFSPIPKTDGIYVTCNDQETPEDLSISPTQNTRSAFIQETIGEVVPVYKPKTYEELDGITSQSPPRPNPKKHKRNHSRKNKKQENKNNAFEQAGFTNDMRPDQTSVYEGGVYVQGGVNLVGTREEEEAVEEEMGTQGRSMTPEAEKSDTQYTTESASIPWVNNNFPLGACKTEPTFSIDETNEDAQSVSTTLESEFLTPQFASFGAQNISMSLVKNRNAASSFVERRSNGKYGCALCGAEYSNRGTLQRHIDGRHLGRNYKCVICHVTFESHSGWSRHLRTKHSQHMPLSCEICGKKFKFSMALEQHKRRLHTEEAKTNLESKKQ